MSEGTPSRKEVKNLEEYVNNKIIDTLKECIDNRNNEIDALNSIIARCQTLQEQLQAALAEG